jgi:hypothetical protein
MEKEKKDEIGLLSDSDDSDLDFDNWSGNASRSSPFPREERRVYLISSNSPDVSEESRIEMKTMNENGNGNGNGNGGDIETWKIENEAEREKWMRDWGITLPVDGNDEGMKNDSSESDVSEMSDESDEEGEVRMNSQSGLFY